MPNPAPINVHEVLASLRKNVWLWSVPAIATTLLAAAYAVLRHDTWKASQALLVRDEAAGSLSRQGRFDNPEAMKTAQETILEMAKSRAVVQAALAAVGPLGGGATADWPAPRHIAQLEQSISVAAPKGAEFGRTEVIYLAATSSSRERAVELVAAVTAQLEARLKELRNRKAQSIVSELERTSHLAKADLDAATRRLEQLETKVGSDLGELRILNELGAGDSNLRGALNEIKTELRQAQSAHEGNKQLELLLTAARSDPQQMVEMPNRLLESQPALRRLKEGLVDAQLRTAQLLGKMSDAHPEVKAAVAAEREVRQNLSRELETAVNGLAADLKVNAALVASLARQAAEVEERLNRLAGLRARYGNLVAESRQAGETFEKAQKDLAEARAGQAAAQSASLIARLDSPRAGDTPVGPSRAAIVLTGMLGGLAAGLGLVFLKAPLHNLGNRRWSDHFRWGRRSEDRSDSLRPVQQADRSNSPRPVQQADRSGLPATGSNSTDRSGLPATGPSNTDRSGTPPAEPAQRAAPAVGNGDRRAGAERRSGFDPRAAGKT